jgi:hypothetical protein
MRRLALLVLGIGALLMTLAVGIAVAAGGEEPAPVRVEEESGLTPGIGFSPKALSRTSRTPIRLYLSQEVNEMYGHPPAERELVIELDRNVMVQTKGLPVCHLGVQTGLTVAEACRGTSVGFGEESIQVAFPEAKPIVVPANVEILNGGERGGAITMYAHASFGSPIGGSVNTKLVFTRIRDGRFGWRIDATLPQIAGGDGSLYGLRLTFGREYGYEGKKASVLSATCVDGKLVAHVRSSFDDGTSGAAEITRACTPKG